MKNKSTEILLIILVVGTALLTLYNINSLRSINSRLDELESYQYEQEFSRFKL